MINLKYFTKEYYAKRCNHLYLALDSLCKINKTREPTREKCCHIDNSCSDYTSYVFVAPTVNDIDYAVLLKKYMNDVLQSEGTTFIDDGGENTYYTKAESVIIKKISKELKKGE